VEEEKGGEVVYAVVNKPRVEMFDNELYASRDSLSSSGEDDWILAIISAPVLYSTDTYNFDYYHMINTFLYW